MSKMTIKEAIDYLQLIADNSDVAKHGEALRVALDAMKDAERHESAGTIYRDALDTFGVQKQTNMLFEEMGELMSAICKHSRGRDKIAHIAEEIADVRIMLDQMTVLYNCEAETERQRRYKLRRLEQRIEEAMLESNLRVFESNLRVNAPLTEEVQP